jgi:hypothetical protein
MTGFFQGHFGGNCVPEFRVVVSVVTDGTLLKRLQLFHREHRPWFLRPD